MAKWYEDRFLLQQTRLKLGLTQLKAAELAGIKRSLVCDLEMGRSPMTAENVSALWGALCGVEAEQEVARRMTPSLASRLAALRDLREPAFDSEGQ